MPRAVRVKCTRELVGRLKVQAFTHRLSDLCGERLRAVRPREGIEVDKHVIAAFQVVGDLEERTATC